MIAVRACREPGLDDLVGVFGQRAGNTGAAGAGLLFAAVWQVRLLALGWRQAGVAGRLGRTAEFGFKFGDASGQGGDLLGLRLDLGMLRQNQGDQVFIRQAEKGCAVHT